MGNESEILICVYWLAHGLSYRVVSSVFGVPKATVHRIIHRVTHNVGQNLNLSPSHKQELQTVGKGFSKLSGTPAFQTVVGSSHIRIKPHRCIELTV